MSKLIPYPDDLREQAKQLFMAHVSINDIASQLQISTSALSQWRSREGWIAERETADEALAADIMSSRKLTLARIAKSGIDEIERTVKHVVERPDPMSVAEAEKMSVLISNLDKISRLDNRESTENIAVGVKLQGALGVDGVRKIVTSDAFLKPDEEAPKDA